MNGPGGKKIYVVVSDESVISLPHNLMVHNVFTWENLAANHLANLRNK
jgi:hypothetical protein